METTAAAGVRRIYVFNQAPGGGTSDSVDFEITNPAPSLVAIQPSNANQLQSLEIQVQGTGFIEGVTSLNMGPGITIDSSSVVNDTVLSASINISGGAALGPRDVWVMNTPPRRRC